MICKNTVLSSCLTLAFLCGCGPSNPQHKAEEAQHDSHDSMIEHIAEGHGIRIGKDTNADIRVSTTGATVTVRFSAEIVRRLPGDCLPVLRLDGPERTLTEDEYGQFLNDFHDYLLLTYGEGGHVPKK